MSYIDWTENNHIRPIELNTKEQYYADLSNISFSLTERIGAGFANSFIKEAVFLIINAVNLFEKGFFDCAYYSLRQSLEIATTMNYFWELDSKKRIEHFQNWNTQQKFPMSGEMITILRKNKETYFDLFSKMEEFFNSVENAKKKINKFVHKQGDEYLYTIRNHPSKQKNDNIYIEEFEDFLKICIGAVAMLRLTIDPLPILLMDKDIYFRTWDTLTRPYDDEFIDKYIGYKYIEKYKQTLIYKSHYNDFIYEEKRLECVVDVIKHKYINKNKINDILTQKHLLSENEILAVILCGQIKKIVKLHTYTGFITYFTNEKTARVNLNHDGFFFKALSININPINHKYDESYISYFKYGNDSDVFLEHNELLTDDEIRVIKNII